MKLVNHFHEQFFEEIEHRLAHKAIQQLNLHLETLNLPDHKPEAIRQQIAMHAGAGRIGRAACWAGSGARLRQSGAAGVTPGRSPI